MSADKKHADALWSQLREAFANAEQIIKEIIETRAWEALGYESFADAWADRMAGVRLATDAMKAHVVYALFDSPAQDDEPEQEVSSDAPAPLVAEPEVLRVYEQAGGVGSGVTPEGVAQLKRQKDNGVPPELATVRVRGYRRQAPDTAEARYLVVELNPDELVQFKALADRHNSNVKVEGAKAIRAWIRKLEEPR